MKKMAAVQVPLMADGREVEKGGDDKIETKSKYHSLRLKILFSAFMYIIYIFHGMNNNVLGPSLIDLEYLTNSSTSSITAVFTWRYGGYFLGTIISGPIVDRVDPALVVGVALCVSATATALTPVWDGLLGLFITSGCGGVAIAFTTVCVAATILEIWGKDAKPYQQALHFFVTLGGAVTPQIMKPFLRMATTTSTNGHTHASENGFQNESSMLLNGTLLGNNSLSKTVSANISFQHNLTHPIMVGDSGSRVLLCYLIVAGCLMTLSVVSIVVFSCAGCKLWKNTQKDASTVERKVVIEGQQKMIILILFFIQSFMYGGIEEVFGGLTLTFVVKYLGWSKHLASDVNTIFWATTTISRGTGVILCRYFQSSTLLAFQLAIVLCATLTMTFAVNLHWIVPWLCFAFAGLGMGSLFPTLINWGHECLSLRGKETSIFFAGASFAKMIIPPLIGFLFERLGAMWFVYMILVQVALFIICYVVNAILIKCLLNRINQELKHNVQEDVKHELSAK